MKIGLITLYWKNYNYGGVLQAYALCEKLRQMGYGAEQIAYDYRHTHGKLSVIKTFVRDIVSFGRYKKIFVNTKLRNRCIRSFGDKIEHSNSLYDNMKRLNKHYDAFIVGSDQVWNFNWLGFTPPFFLDFVNDDKLKISYAASMGQRTIPANHKEQVAALLSRFDAISVREASMIEELENITSVHPSLVLDPTLLLEKEDWDRIKAECSIEKYIFVYLLGNSVRHRKMIEQFAFVTGLKIVTFPYLSMKNDSDKNFGDYRIYNAGPGEFIGYIANAEYVITDSFHASVFSLIYKKKFLCLKRFSDDDTRSMNDRVVDLMKMINHEELVVNDDEDYVEKVDEININYDKVEKIIKLRRQESIHFIESALHVVPKGKDELSC